MRVLRSHGSLVLRGVSRERYQVSAASDQRRLLYTLGNDYDYLLCCHHTNSMIRHYAMLTQTTTALILEDLHPSSPTLGGSEMLDDVHLRPNRSAASSPE